MINNEKILFSDLKQINQKSYGKFKGLIRVAEKKKYDAFTCVMEWSRK